MHNAGHTTSPLPQGYNPTHKVHRSHSLWISEHWHILNSLSKVCRTQYAQHHLEEHTCRASKTEKSHQLWHTCIPRFGFLLCFLIEGKIIPPSFEIGFRWGSGGGIRMHRGR